MKKFNALPTEARVRELSPIQMVWIIQNMKADADAEEHYYKYGRNKNVSVQEFESDQDAIDEINQMMKDGKL